MRGIGCHLRSGTGHKEGGRLGPGSKETHQARLEIRPVLNEVQSSEYISEVFDIALIKSI